MRSIWAALRSLVLPYGTTSGQRIILDGINGKISIYDTSNNLVAEIDATGAITSYDRAVGSFLQMLSGGLSIGNIVSGVPDTSNSGLFEVIDDGSGKLTILITRSARSVSKDNPAQIAQYSGSQNQPTGSSINPQVIISDLYSNSAVDLKLSGNVIRTYETWHLPSYAAGWSGATAFSGVSPVETLAYRLTTKDTVEVYGACTVTAAGAGAVPFSVPSGYYDSARQSGFGAIEKQAAGAMIPGFFYVSSAGNAHFDIGTNWTRNVGDVFFLNGEIPLGNLA